MIPDVTLELDHDGVRIVSRDGAEEVEVGSVRLDDPDFEDKLGRLRGEAGDTEPVAVQVAIPATLVLFIDVGETPDSALAERVEAETSCSIDELVIGRSGIVAAAVERATLEEAQDFTTARGFQPVLYVARRPGGTEEVTFSLETGPMPQFRSHRAAVADPMLNEGGRASVAKAAPQGSEGMGGDAPSTPAAKPTTEPAASEAEAFTVFGARDPGAKRWGTRPLYAAAAGAAFVLLLAAYFVGGESSTSEIVGLEATSIEGAESASTDALDVTDPVAVAAVDPVAEAPSPPAIVGDDVTALDDRTPDRPDIAPEFEEETSPGAVSSTVVELPVPTPSEVPAEPPALVAPRAPEFAAVTGLPPPPPGSVFDLDEKGRVRPSEDGALSPSGVIVYSGAPSVVPPNRPDDMPENATPASPEPQVAETQDDAALGRSPGVAAPPDIARVRPESRPDQGRGAVAPVVSLAVDDTPRPRSRPETAAARRDPLDSDFDALAARARTESGAATATIASTRAAEPPPPEPVGRLNVAVPTMPTRGSVAKQATLTNAIQLDRVNLIGVYGAPSDRRALIRLPSGRYIKVKVGDRVDGGRIAAIQASRLEYVKGGRSYALTLPNG